MRSIFIALVAITACIGAFASLTIYSQGWEHVTYGGADPWAPVFLGAGGASLPVGIATAMAGVWKLASRGSSFLSVWLVVLTIVSLIFLWSGLTVANYQPT